jgi:hypothetical protein
MCEKAPKIVNNTYANIKLGFYFILILVTAYVEPFD